MQAQEAPTDSTKSGGYTLRFLPESNVWRLNAAPAPPGVGYFYMTELPDIQRVGASLEQTNFTPRFSFRDSLDLPKAARLKVAPFRGDTQLAEATYFTLAEHLALGKPVIFSPEIGSLSDSIIGIGLTDGRLGSPDFRDGAWVAWQDSAMEMMLHFDDPIAAKTVSLNFLHAPDAHIFPPQMVEFFTSDDGLDWQLAWVNEFNINHLKTQASLEASVWLVPPEAKITYLRLVVSAQPTVARHWIFADEVFVR